MISIIFGKTKPINFIILLSFLFIFYWITHLLVFDNNYTYQEIVPIGIALLALLFSVLVIEFIIKRNKMTEPNSFAMLFYTVLFLVFPKTLMNTNLIFCSLFLLLGCRRLISIRSLKNIKLKVFDATLWIVLGSIFYKWAILYMILVFAAIYIYEPKNLKNWLVPFVAAFTAVVIAYTVLTLTSNIDLFYNQFEYNFNFEAMHFSNLATNYKLLIYIILVLLLGVFAFLKLGKAGLGKIVTLRLIALAFATGILIILLDNEPDEQAILLTFFPAVVFITNYVEAIKRTNIKELVLLTSILAPVFLLVIEVWVE